MAGVLHQKQLGRHRKGLVAVAALHLVATGIGQPFGVDGDGAPQIEGGFGKQLVGKRHRHRNQADTRQRLVHLGKVSAEALELLDQLRLVGVQQLPDLFTARRVSLTQRPQIARGQRFHQFFNLELAQLRGQQHHAAALVFHLQEVQAESEQGREKK